MQGDFLSGTIEPLAFLVIVVTSFFGAAVTATFSVGGGLLLIAVMGSLLPAAAVVPVHGVVMLGSNTARAAVFRRGIDRRTVAYFLGGALVGAVIGGQVATALPSAALRLTIGAFILATQWGPPWRLPFGGRSFAVAGGVSTLLTLFVGASGPFITTLLARMPGYDRINVTGTAAACMVIQHGLKVVVFGMAGFVFAPFVPLIAVSIVAGFLGTLLGARILSRIDEAAFRRVLKWLLTGLALYLVGLALAELLGS